MTPSEAEQIEALLDEIDEIVADDSLADHAAHILGEADGIAQAVLGSGSVPSPPDPFKGRDDAIADDPSLSYTMFWRMFDKTPAAMLQPLAIPLRRILAARIFKSCGDGVIFHHDVLFNRGDNITIGDHSLINRRVMLDDRAAIDIGPFVMVSAGVTIETHTHPFTDFSLPIAYAGREGLPVSVGANTVLGYNAVVMAGTRIGYRCIVGANSVVTKDVPDYTVVGGVPAQVIKEYLPPEDGPVWSPEDGRPRGV